MIFLVFLASQFLASATFAEASENEAASALTSAENAIVSAYQEVLKAEEAGANVSGLLAQLSKAGEDLVSARMAFNHNPHDFDKAVSLANSSRDIAEEVQNAAVGLEKLALSEGLQHTLFTMMASVVGMALTAFGSLWVWHLLKKRRSESGFLKQIRGVVVNE